ncbi:MAG: DUF5615 family PIN-like protein [Ignavibacteriota bacterium]
MLSRRDSRPRCRHTRSVRYGGLELRPEKDLAIVSKDADFRQRSFLSGHPPKVLWIRVGNCSTAAIEALMRARRPEIEQFLEDRQKSFLALF